MTSLTDARTLEALLRSDFRAFVHKVFTTLCPGQKYVSTWHVEAIAWQLERVRRGEIRRLIINMPAAVAEIDHGLSRLSDLRPGARPLAPHHLCQLLGRPGAKAQ
jgi:hypothetical protein